MDIKAEETWLEGVFLYFGCYFAYTCHSLYYIVVI